MYCSEEDYRRFRVLLRFFVKQVKHNYDIKIHNGHLSFTCNYRRNGSINKEFLDHYHLSENWNIFPNNLHMRMVFQVRGYCNTENTTYINIYPTWINIIPLFDGDDKGTITGLKSLYRGNRDTNPVSDMPNPKVFSIEALQLDEDGDPTPELKELLDHQEEMWLHFQNTSKQKIQITNFEADIENALLQDRNIILHGAPGTGKTFIARKIAAHLIGIPIEQLDNSRQFGFVQFHPNYDYTDFVEGLRPYQDTNGNMSFKLTPGIFYNFCETARNHTTKVQLNTPSDTHDNDVLPSQKELFYDALNQFITDIEKEKSAPNSRGGIDVPAHNDDTPITLTTSMDDKGELQLTLLRDISYRFTKTNLWATYSEATSMPDNGLKNYYLSIVNYLENYYNLPEYSSDDFADTCKETTDNALKYVFVIDEINRGDLARIFGELFYSIDPDYRGPSGSVETQYTNMHETDSKFYVPNNVFIIATMNDVDRNVDMLDFAVRRRFRFINVRASDTQDAILMKCASRNTLVQCMNSLNTIIEKEIGPEFELGANYFTKARNQNTGDTDFDALWQNFLQPLLSEYLRGHEDVHEIIDRLNVVYRECSGHINDISTLQ